MQNFSIGSVSVYLFLFLVVLTIIFIPVIIFVFMRDRSLSKYDKQRQEVVLSAVRETYEEQISSLSKRLTATEDRWQELNHLILSSQKVQQDIPANIDPSAIPLLREYNIALADVAIDPKLVFVLTPFLENEDRVFRSIKLVCNGLGLNCVRGDEKFVSGEVLPHIVRLMMKSAIIIANVGGRNPNVFYELGIAHTVGRTTILLSETIDEVPFDIKTKRVITYHDSLTLEKRVRAALAHALSIPEFQSNAASNKTQT
ncbi:hypothetical protein SAMN05428969_0381 [Devosia sp. YR412]|uniref:hypothetical protein n=1 Tax=Devosia sp. YR412 TaxID=1881030 RepID=UPI0008B7521A|nr:hypothetical protein [Devosia sp. YR412]SEP66846.1 hypothetical protein SAMN05428969_0381 [Devosia sp. YR412]